jgi:hypothetical protein
MTMACGLPLRPSSNKLRPNPSGYSYIKAKRACPPEDCGGVWGYQNVLDAIQSTDHPEHEEMLEWIGGAFDPEEAELDEINRLLKTIPHDTTKLSRYTF